MVVRDEQRLSRYRFGLEQIDFLVCAECGSYSGAVLEDAERPGLSTTRSLTDSGKD